MLLLPNLQNRLNLLPKLLVSHLLTHPVTVGHVALLRVHKAKVWVSLPGVPRIRLFRLLVWMLAPQPLPRRFAHRTQERTFQDNVRAILVLPLRRLCVLRRLRRLRPRLRLVCLRPAPCVRPRLQLPRPPQLNILRQPRPRQYLSPRACGDSLFLQSVVFSMSGLRSNLRGSGLLRIVSRKWLPNMMQSQSPPLQHPGELTVQDMVALHPLHLDLQLRLFQPVGQLFWTTVRGCPPVSMCVPCLDEHLDLFEALLDSNPLDRRGPSRLRHPCSTPAVPRLLLRIIILAFIEVLV